MTAKIRTFGVTWILFLGLGLSAHSAPPRNGSDTNNSGFSYSTIASNFIELEEGTAGVTVSGVKFWKTDSSGDSKRMSEQVGFGFAFNYYGRFFTTCTISPYGAIGMGELGDQFFPELTSGDRGNILAPLYSEESLYPDRDTQTDDAGKALYKTIGDAPNRRFVIQFKDVECYGEPIEGQVHFLETSNVIEFHYRDRGATWEWEEAGDEFSNSSTH